MNIFDQIARNIQQVRKDLHTDLVSAMASNKEEVVDANVDQIERGIAPDEGYIGKYRSDEYAKYKKSIGSKAPSGKVDLKLEGDFIGGIFANPVADGLSIDSTDYKTDKLEEKYDGRIFGLTPKSKQDLAPQIVGEYLKKFKDEITRV